MSTDTTTLQNAVQRAIAAQFRPETLNYCVAIMPRRGELFRVDAPNTYNNWPVLAAVYATIDRVLRVSGALAEWVEFPDDAGAPHIRTLSYADCYTDCAEAIAEAATDRSKQYNHELATLESIDGPYRWKDDALADLTTRYASDLAQIADQLNTVRSTLDYRIHEEQEADIDNLPL